MKRNQGCIAEKLQAEMWTLHGWELRLSLSSIAVVLMWKHPHISGQTQEARMPLHLTLAVVFPRSHHLEAFLRLCALHVLSSWPCGAFIWPGEGVSMDSYC